MIVVDTNVMVYFWLPSERAEAADSVMLSDTHWWAPFLWRSEFLNALSVHLRQGLVSQEGARDAAARAARHMTGRERAVAMQDVLSLVARTNCSAYDCEFVALAMELGVPLITEDRRILNQFPNIAMDMESFLS